MPLVMMGLVAALVGRAFEQGSGVGRVSDLLVFWAVMGLVIAASEVDAGATPRNKFALPSISKFGMRGLAPIAGVAVAILLALLVFIPKDVQTLRAGWIGANGFENKASGNTNEAFIDFENARDLAPDVERYAIESSAILANTGINSADINARVALLNAARDVLLSYEQRDRLSWQTQLQLAALTLALFQSGDESLKPEAVNRHLGIASLMAPYSTIQASIAEAMVVMGEFQLGAIIAQESIRLEPTTTPVPGAWWALGEAMFQLDNVDEAKLAWETTLIRSPFSIYSGRAHRGLSFIAQLEGDTDLAKMHNTHAIEQGS